MKTSKIPISIGIPFYNAGEYLADAIRSIFAQTHQDWELLLVDDGSTDRSLDIAHSVIDSRVRVFSDGENRKLPYRLNQITAEARYDLIGRMDADDLISPTRFEKQVAILDARPEIDLVTTGVCSITNSSRPVGTRCGDPTQQITGKGLLMGQCAIVHAAMLGRKSWFLRNPYDPAVALGQDYELWLRAFANDDFKVKILNEPLYYYREENNATSAKLLKAYRSQICQIKRYGKIWLTPYEMLILIAKYKCKCGVVRCLDFFNKTDVLLKNRNISVDDKTLHQHLLHEIETVVKTRLPGEV